MFITQDRIEEILNQMAQVRVGVLGDFCLDAYWTLDLALSFNSVETGKLVQPVTAQEYRLGGAGNVAANLAALGVGHVAALAVVGTDPFGQEMLRLLGDLGVDAQGVLVQKGDWSTNVYIKPFEGDEEQKRYDFGVTNRLAAQTEANLVALLEEKVKDLDILIVNQQIANGVLTGGVIAALNRLAAGQTRCRIILDSRDRSDQFQRVWLKINESEAARLCGEPLTSLSQHLSTAQVEQYLKRLTKRMGAPIFLSRGARGLSFGDGETQQHQPGVMIMGKTDTVGCGDTMIASLAAVLATGATQTEAATVGNLAASITAQKLRQTGTASPAELLELAPHVDYNFNEELAINPRAARYLPGSEIELVTSDLPVGQIAHAVFDHDGTISTLRQGWEEVMEPVMMRAILGKAYDTVSQAQFETVRERVADYIDKSTGIQTILQMKGLVKLVEEFGFVPAEERLDAWGYKAIYNEALMEGVNRRMAKIERGELDPADFTLKGAIDFLHTLHSRGVTLYLASGTDEQDVINEAKALGYADLFTGGIWGAKGDVARDSKKMVIERIIRQNNLSGAQLICFGDGPVELRETRRRGGLCVGLASDELQRFGLNASKRARVIKAGADLVISDYSQRSILLDFLKI